MDSNALGLKFGVLQKQTLAATSTMETVFVFCFEDSSHGYGERVSYLGLELWILYLGH